MVSGGYGGEVRCRGMGFYTGTFFAWVSCEDFIPYVKHLALMFSSLESLS